MSGTKIKQIIQVHIIDPEGNDHYAVFITPKRARRFVSAMRKMQIPAEIV